MKIDLEKALMQKASRIADAEREHAIAAAFHEAADEHEREAWKFEGQAEAIQKLIDNGTAGASEEGTR